MKITEENYTVVPEKERRLLKALLTDIEFINNNSKNKLFINWIDCHTQYSPERVDPCPDYYGMYELRLEDDPRESIGVEMTLDELDIVICALSDFKEHV